MDNSIYLFEAEGAYKKFLKSSKGFLGLKKRENLKSFGEVQKNENAYNSVYLGIKEVPLSKIVGSVEKYTDFDKNFVPKNNIVKQRWMNIYTGYMAESMLPPVILYKIKDDYYVYDGNHRISVAKFLNFVSVEAEVEEFLPSKDAADEIIYRESMVFEKETGIKDVILSNPLKYKHLKNEIKSYVNFVHKKKNEDADYKTAAENWNKNIFIPVKILIEKNDILKNFPDNNINDIFLFLLDHKYFMSEKIGKNIGYFLSTVDFINRVKTNEKRNLTNECRFEDKETLAACEKLRKIDNELIHSSEETEINEKLFKLTGIDFRYDRVLLEEVEKIGTPEKWYEENYKKITEYFYNKADKLPEKYSRYLQYFEENRIFGYIFEYKCCKNFFENENPEISVLNYIIEVFLPIISSFDDTVSEKEKIIYLYEKIQNQYFYLFRIEKRLVEEGKTTKYEKIIADNLLNIMSFKNEQGYYDIKGILINRKYEEFLDNLKKPEEFLNIYKKYGESGKYETFTKLFEMLDILGEKKFLKKIKNDLKKMFLSDDILADYKMKDILTEFNNNLGKEKDFYNREKYSFIDFYADILSFTKETAKDEDNGNIDLDIDILDMEMYYREKEKIYI
ncbi:DUF4032 domain-containing protein [Pseudoleptotrichia goodfellowii]|uniref:DUF4032 domain-containing protein n=1 Tax=Pseudoleptotrichia goodfellowii TaxID=157692 RepID=A0A510JD09_9FUSO|nr:DUF4032 domain-containing protein [Pseudoleptotrichia goodfellowii]BBM37114.1 hypothetical protein JCM16774_2066 [Pseudoleptotrichia goodfellowii]